MKLKIKHGHLIEIDESDLELVSKYSWKMMKSRNRAYVVSIQTINGKQKCILLHRLILNALEVGKTIIHIDKNTLNNKRSNLAFGKRKTLSRHGMYKTPEYMVWINMKNRCSNPKQINYKLYGGRGISVCKEWDESFEAFYGDMGSRPSPHHSIDRINTNLGYYKDNCRWTTKLIQVANTRKHSDSGNKYKGVRRRGNKFYARITINHREINLGSFKSEKEAALAYNNEVIKHYGNEITVNNIEGE